MEQDSTGDHYSLQRLANEFGLGDINTVHMPQNIMDAFYRVNPKLRPIARGTTAATPIVILDSSDEEEEEDGFYTAPGSPLQATPINPTPVNPAVTNPAPAREYITQEEQIRIRYEHRYLILLQHMQHQHQ